MIRKSIRRVVIRITRAKDNQYYFILLAGNGEVVVASETYTRKLDAQRGAKRFQEMVTEAVMEVDQ